MDRLTKILMRHRRGKGGFTLVELMIVVIIVGILAAVAVPIYRGFVTKAYLTEAKACVGAIRAAEMVYYAEMDDWLVPTGIPLDPYETTDQVLARLGVEIGMNRWFKDPPATVITWVDNLPDGTGTEDGVNIIGTATPVTDLGAQISFETGVIDITTDNGTTWTAD